MAILSEDNIKSIIDFCDITSLYSFYANKEYNEYIKNKDWKSIWVTINKKSAISEFSKKTNFTANKDYKNVVKLAGFTGCMMCNKKNIRKVWWEFGIRCCAECLHANTIGEWIFEKKIPLTTYSYLPFTRKDMYNKYYGNYTIKFYWKKTIDQLLLLHAPVPIPLPTLVQVSVPVSTLVPTQVKQIKIKKNPSEKDIECCSLRKEQIDKLCINNNIILSEALQRSDTYNKNVKISSKLQIKKFTETKIPNIMMEIEEKKEQEEKEKMEKGKEKERQEKEKVEKEKEKCTTKKYICEKCANSTRLFCYMGLKQHVIHIHK